MSNNYVQAGNVMDYVNNTGTDIVSGEFVVIGNIQGVAAVNIADTETGSVDVVGVFKIDKLSTDVVTQGGALYWDSTNTRLTIESSGNTLVGIAFEAAGSSDTTVNMKLNSL